MNKLIDTQGAVQQRPLIVGLTGGIASGKSMVSRYLAEIHAVPIVDTDVIARDLVKVGSPTLDEIIAHFGVSIVDKQGNLNRRQLRDIISQHAHERLWLNALMHPRIYDAVMAHVKQLSASPHPYIVIVIPLLSADSPYLDLLNAVWVVDCDEEQQKQHLIARDQMNAQIAQQLIDAQPSRQERLNLATAIIENTGSTDELLDKTERLHQRFISNH
ncbi:MAG: dephospho-CoA kinase [Gammaproteobacteria bacterium]|nr:dephospho-CoA kinase [Gammaproteobacteria bacterium]